MTRLYNVAMQAPSESAASRAEELREKLLLTFDMFEAGLSLMREKLRREDPSLSEEALEAQLIAWLGDRPPDGPTD